MSSRAVFVWAVITMAVFSCGVRAAPEAFGRRLGDYTNLISPALMQELEDLVNTDSGIQDLKQREELAAVVEYLHQYQKELQQQQQQQQTDDYTNRQDSGIAAVPESYSSLPIPMNIPTKIFRSQEAPIKDENKRGNQYTYACHFKICNIGRRQNYRRSPWIRR